MSARGYRASLLWFPDPTQPVVRWEEDGLLVVAPDAQGRQVVQAIGDWRTLSALNCRLPVEHLPGRIIAPGFVDMHVHFPQTNVIGSPADGLLPWLENYTFPEEQRFADAGYGAEAATFFVDELLRNGVSTALAFATTHSTSVDALFSQAQARGMRLITGLCLMDRHAPPALLNQPGRGRDAVEHSLCESEDLIARWHGQGRLGYAITPRFAPTCSDAQLRGAGELAVDGEALRQPPREGKVLIVDGGGAFRDHLAQLVGAQRLAVAWTDSAPAAVRLCDETPVSLAMINTSTPSIDPYALCAAIKAQEGAGRTAVVFLVGRAFCYDTARAHSAGVRGLLDQPVGDRSLVAMLMRLTSMSG